jgi:hypothetical protein
MKRALMTFGNQFGLALYDKEQSNVSSVDLARIQEFRDQVDTAESVADLDKSIEEYREDIIELKIKRRLDWSQLDEKVRARRVELSEEKEK